MINRRSLLGFLGIAPFVPLAKAFKCPGWVQIRDNSSPDHTHTLSQMHPWRVINVVRVPDCIEWTPVGSRESILWTWDDYQQELRDISSAPMA